MTARELITMLCTPVGLDEDVSEPRSECATYKGFGGYPFSDEGYGFMNRVIAGGGLAAWPAVGDWPYHIVLLSKKERAIVRYMEGDLEVRLYNDQPGFERALERELRENPCP